jgi:hypothetical protein
LAHALVRIISSSETRWSLPFGSLAYPGCSFSCPTGFTKLTDGRLQLEIELSAFVMNSTSSRRCVRPGVPGA